MTDETRQDIILYGNPTCPLIAPVRTMFGLSNVKYSYVNIHADEDGRQFVRATNGGHEGVPVVRFPDDSTLSEPPLSQLRAQLQAQGYRVPSYAVWLARVVAYRFVILPILLVILLILGETVL